jgi:hypothetical protein
MRVPPLKYVEAVKTGRIDGRARHIAVRFRGYFRCLDVNGAETTIENDIDRIQLTPRGEDYWAKNKPK